MFELDMNALRQTAKQPWLTANPANLANLANEVLPPASAEKPLAKLAAIATLAISHDLLAARLMAAAMRRCDQFNDSDKARQDMREQILETPLHDRQDLLDYFTAQTQQKTRP